MTTIDLTDTLVRHGGGVANGPAVRVRFAPRPPRRGREAREPRRFMLATPSGGSLLIEQSEVPVPGSGGALKPETHEYIVPASLVLAGKVVDASDYLAGVMAGDRPLFEVAQEAAT